MLDFVISLVRDPEAALRYAANPAQAIADAHLTNVTSIDVNNLIPMVSDSLSMTAPAGPVVGAPVADHGNVWASGAATAALDAFTPHVPAAVAHPHGLGSGVISQPITPGPGPGPGESPPDPHPLGIDPHDPSALMAGAEMPEHPVDHGVFGADELAAWDHSVIHPHPAEPDHHGFGLHG